MKCLWRFEFSAYLKWSLVCSLFAFSCLAADGNILGKLLESRLYCEGGSSCVGIQNRMSHYHVPGISVALIQKGKVFTYTKGLKKDGDASAVDKNTLFQACSISKPFASLIALELFKQKKLSLDADVNQFLKTWKVPTSSFTLKHPVTLRNLLNHTAGFRSGRGYDFGVRDKIPTLLEILRGEFEDHSKLSKPAVEVEFEPGSKFQYSTTGYTVLQQVIEDIASKPFLKLGEDLLKQLNMRQSNFSQPLSKELWNQTAHSHDENGNPFQDDWRVNPQVAAAGLWTTPSDLASFILEFQRALTRKVSKPIDSEIALQMTTLNKENFGLGIKTGEVGKSKWFSHGGDNAGFKALMVGFVQRKDGLVVMTNSDSGFELALEIFRAVGKEMIWPELDGIKF